MQHNRELCGPRPPLPLLVLLSLLLVCGPAFSGAEKAQQEARVTQAEQAEKEKEEGKKEPSKLFRALGWAVYGTLAADAISTEIALSRGAYEANPLMRNRPVRISCHVVTPVVVNYVTEKARKKGHEKLALWMRIALVAGYGYVTVHNLRQGVEP